MIKYPRKKLLRLLRELVLARRLLITARLAGTSSNYSELLAAIMVMRTKSSHVDIYGECCDDDSCGDSYEAECNGGPNWVAPIDWRFCAVWCSLGCWDGACLHGRVFHCAASLAGGSITNVSPASAAAIRMMK
eukprot:gene17644-436_t